MEYLVVGILSFIAGVVFVIAPKCVVVIHDDENGTITTSYKGQNYLLTRIVRRVE